MGAINTNLNAVLWLEENWTEDTVRLIVEDIYENYIEEARSCYSCLVLNMINLVIKFISISVQIQGNFQDRIYFRSVRVASPTNLEYLLLIDIVPGRPRISLLKKPITFASNARPMYTSHQNPTKS